jgi:hypothetical protein
VYQQPNRSFRPLSLLEKGHSNSKMMGSEDLKRRTRKQMGRNEEERARKELIHLIHDTLYKVI